MDKMALYNRLPVPLQNVACSVEGGRIKHARYGGDYNEVYAGYLRRAAWSPDEVADYRDKQLRVMVGYCYEKVPYYRNLFKQGGIDPSTIQGLDDLKVIPTLTKQLIKENPEQFIAEGFSRRDLIKEHTSGSTGSSLVFYITKLQMMNQWATWRRYFDSHGIFPETWCADFGSRTIVPKNQTKPPYWRISKPLRQIKLSAFHGTDEAFFDFFEIIDKKRIAWIHGYPTCIAPFAAFMKREGLRFLHDVIAVTTGGENLYGYQRALFEEVFRAPVYTHYGMSEGVANFSEKEAGCYIVDEDFAACEFIPVEGGEGLRIVGTSLWNYGMPLLRYETDDIASDVSVDSEGRRYVGFIDGRSGELVVLPDGSTIGALSALFTETENIHEAQIHQNQDYSLDISFAAVNENWENDIREVRKKLEDRIGNQVDVRFIRVDRVSRTKSGKVRYITSDIVNKVSQNVNQ